MISYLITLSLKAAHVLSFYNVSTASKKDANWRQNATKFYSSFDRCTSNKLHYVFESVSSKIITNIPEQTNNIAHTLLEMDQSSYHSIRRSLVFVVEVYSGQNICVNETVFFNGP